MNRVQTELQRADPNVVGGLGSARQPSSQRATKPATMKSATCMIGFPNLGRPAAGSTPNMRRVGQPVLDTDWSRAHDPLKDAEVSLSIVKEQRHDLREEADSQAQDPIGICRNPELKRGGECEP